MNARAEPRLPFGLNKAQIAILLCAAVAASLAALFPNWRRHPEGRRDGFGSFGRAFYRTPPSGFRSDPSPPEVDTTRRSGDLAVIALLAVGLSSAVRYQRDDARPYARQVAERRKGIALLLALLGPTPPPLHLLAGRALFPPIATAGLELIAQGGIGNMYAGLPWQIAIVILILPVYLLYFALAYAILSAVMKPATGTAGSK